VDQGSRSSLRKTVRISVDEVVNELTAQANRQVQNGSPGAWDQNASAFLDQAHGMLPANGNSGPGYMFYATPTQKADPNMYAGYYSNGVGLNMPSASAITTSANRDQANRNLMSAGVIAGATGSGFLVGGPIAVSVGSLGYAAIGGVTGGGMDAAGQYAQSGTVSPVETGFAAMTGALAGPIGANVGFRNNVLLGAVTSGVNTAFNNAYYGESNSISYAGALGALGGALGYGIGMLTTQGLSQILKPFIYEDLNSTIPALLQPRVPNPVPGLAGATSGGIGSGMTSFVPNQPAPK
jgi:filamentous hemagglutinin